MDAWWDFIVSESNRTALSWLGAALSSVVLAAWSLIKFFSKAGRRTNHHEPSRRQTKIMKMGIFGRDISISGSVFFGERRSTWISVFVIFAVFASISLYLAWAARDSGPSPVQVVQQYTSASGQEAHFYVRAAERYEERDGSGLDSTLASSALSGSWNSRWRRAGQPWISGVARVSSLGDKMIIEYQDDTSYKIEAEYIVPGIILGRHVNLSNPIDSTRWIGFVDSWNFIKGYWELGDWDFSR